MLRIENLGNEQLYNIIEDAEFRILTFTTNTKDCFHPYVENQREIIRIAKEAICRRRQAEQREIERIGLKELQELRDEITAEYKEYLAMEFHERINLSNFLQDELAIIVLIDEEMKRQEELNESVKTMSDGALEILRTKLYLELEPWFGGIVERKDADFLKLLDEESERRAKKEEQTLKIKSLKSMSDEDLEGLRREKTRDIDYWLSQMDAGNIEITPILEEDSDYLHEIIEEMMEREKKQQVFANDFLEFEIKEVESLGIDAIDLEDYNSFIEEGKI